MPIPIHVLVVDDDNNVRKSLARFLEDEGFRVTSTESPDEALEIVAGKTVDVAIVDIRLPRKDGNELILEAHRMHPDLRFLIHTGTANYELPQPVQDIGVCVADVFLKPVMDLSAFTQAIHGIIGA